MTCLKRLTAKEKRAVKLVIETAQYVIKVDAYNKNQRVVHLEYAEVNLMRAMEAVLILMEKRGGNS